MTRRFNIIILVTIIGLSAFKTPDLDYVLTIKKGTIKKQGEQTYWVIPTTLTNKSKDTLRYFSMSCSWQDFYSVDSRKLNIEPSLCEKNIPTILTIAPGQSSMVHIRLIVSQTMDTKEIKFKIGFNLIAAHKGQNPFDYDDKEGQKNKNIIWSNLISM